MKRFPFIFISVLGYSLTTLHQEIEEKTLTKKLISYEKNC
jgi:hypothetical protein